MTEDRISRDKRRFETWQEAAEFVIKAAVGVAALVVAIFAVIALSSWISETDARKERWNTIDLGINNFVAASENMRVATENFKNDSAKLGPVIDDTKANLNTTFGNLDTQVARFGSLVAAIETSTLPRINTGVETINRQIEANGKALETSQVKIADLIDRTAPRVEGILTQLEKGAEGLALVTNDPKIHGFIETANQVIVKVDKAAGEVVLMAQDGRQITAQGIKIAENLEGVTADAKRVSQDSADYVHASLFPERKWYHKFILTPLKAVSGLGLIYYNLSK